MKSHKNVYVRYTLLEITIIHFKCIYLNKGRYYSVLARFLADEIAQKFIYKIYIIRNNNDGIWAHVAQ